MSYLNFIFCILYLFWLYFIHQIYITITSLSVIHILTLSLTILELKTILFEDISSYVIILSSLFHTGDNFLLHNLILDTGIIKELVDKVWKNKDLNTYVHIQEEPLKFLRFISRLTRLWGINLELVINVNEYVCYDALGMALWRFLQPQMEVSLEFSLISESCSFSVFVSVLFQIAAKLKCVCVCVYLYIRASETWEEDPEPFYASYYRRSLDNKGYMFRAPYRTGERETHSTWLHTLYPHIIISEAMFSQCKVSLK